MGDLKYTKYLPTETLDGTEYVGVQTTTTLERKTTAADIAALAAANSADVLVKTANASLSAERVVTDTSSVSWDWATAGQAKANVAAGGVTAAMLANAVADAFALLDVTPSAEAGNKITLTIQAQDLQGNNLAAAVGFWIELVSAADASYAVSDEGAGAVTFNNTTSKRTLCTTDGAGLAQIGITDVAAETISLAIGSGPGATVFVRGLTLDLTFA